MKKKLMRNRVVAATLLWSLFVLPMAVIAQTTVRMPKNKYKVQDDVKLGMDASRQVEQQFPILNDGLVDNYVEDVGSRLVAAIPPEYRHNEFRYQFDVVNARDINAFALPGGPMYVNRGMIEAAKTEGEMAGVMAHEIAHVALRHATAQATKQSSWKNQLGMIGMILGGAVLGGETGAQLGMLGAQAWMTKYSREYETQADIVGARIMADAGYDPRDLANMFRTIAQEGGSRGPEWLSSHPDPGNRYQNINREAQYLNVSSNPIKVTREFSRVQERLRSMPRALTMAEIERNAQRTGGAGNPTAGGRYTRNVPLPSRSYKTYRSGNWISMNVPSNWREFSTSSQVTFAPEGAYGDNGITHGTMMGVAQSSGSLYNAAQEYIQGLAQANGYLRQQGGLQRATLGGRTAYAGVLSGRSPVTGDTEVVTVYVTQLRSGEMFWLATVAPQGESYNYNNAFRTMINSIRLNA